MKTFLRTFALFFIILVLPTAFFVLDLFKRWDLVLPRTYIGSLNLTGMSREQAERAIHERIETFLNEPFLMTAQADSKQVSLKEMDIIVDEDNLIQQVPFASQVGDLQLLTQVATGTKLAPRTTITGPVTRTELLRILDRKFPTIPKVKNAYFVREGKNLKIVEGVAGVTADIDGLIADINSRLGALQVSPLAVRFTDEQPTVMGADLTAHRAAILAQFPNTLRLFYPSEQRASWKIAFDKAPQLIQFERKPYEIAAGEIPLTMYMEPTSYGNFLADQKIIETLERSPEDIRIFTNDEGTVQFVGHGTDGRAIERDRLFTLINEALNTKKTEVEIPLAVIPPMVDISPDLQALGIKELYAVGYTRFEGSPVNRMHNIGVGVDRYNGVLIKPGETFSFNKQLGEVDASTGYKPELVIKAEGTIPEYGGGLCQVSTTLYRAAIYGGLPITDRAPHSYAVTYYSQVGGHGLDATIYPPIRDLKFLNDTGNHLLIHSYVDGPSAYFKLFGTKDDRSVRMEGPYISNKHSIDPTPILVYDPKLKAGQKKQVEKAHTGFDTLWYRHLTKNGETVKEEIRSRYKATPNKILVGDPIKPEGTEVAETNPFE